MNDPKDNSKDKEKFVWDKDSIEIIPPPGKYGWGNGDITMTKPAPKPKEKPKNG